MRQLNCILLVDDNPADNRLHRDLILEVGCAKHIEIATDGQQALNYLTCGEQYADNNFFPSPELILLDLHMPCMDGWEFLEAHEKLPPEQKGKHVVTMLTSAPVLDDNNVLGLKYNVSDVMHKPLRRDQLLNLLNQYWPEFYAKSNAV